MANAAVINIDSSTANSLRTAINGAASGDEIVMADGTYNESGDYLAFTGKEVTVRAAEGAEVTIKTVCPVRLKEGAKAEFINVKFDCSTIGSYDYVIVPADDTDNKRVVLTGCEFYGWEKNKAMIEATSSRRLAAVTIDKCYFHDCMKSVVFIENTVSIDLSITNSTFANIATNTESFSAGVIDSRATAGSFLVDHCTFYNVQAMNTDYAAIGKVLTPGAIVSNCIFVLPTSTDGQRAIRDVAQANNCLTFNYLKDSGKGIHGDVVKNNCIFADPLFEDAANSDFSLAGDWTTMTISPARYAGTDGSHLGDPRWHSTETLPSTSFASAYDLLGTKAMLSGRIELNASNKIHFNHNADVADGTAKWKLHVGRACIVSALVDVETDCVSGRQLTLTVKDADDNTVATLAQPSATYNDADINLGQIAFSEEGDYTFILTNSLFNSGVVLEKITLSYIGGAVQNMPGTTAIADAWFSSNGTRADSKITFPNGKHDVGWVKWNVAFASAGNYNVTVNVNNTDGHNFTVALYRSESDESPISVGEGGSQYSSGSPNAIALGAMEVPAGNYIMKVTDAVAWSNAELLSVTIAYAGGAVVNIPNNNIPLTEAILADGATRDGDGLHFKNAQYVKWNIHATEGLYTFTAHCTSPSTENYSNLMITVKQGNTELYSYAPQYYYNQADKEIQSPAWLLDAGDYTLELSNPTSGNGYLTSLAATAPSNMFILDDNKTDDGSIAAAAEAGTSYKFLLKRSFTAGRYYTICIPVGSWNDELKLAFGADYELWKMTSAEQNGDAIDLNFDQINGQSFHAGWPYIIKPSVDVQNPVLYNEKTIANSTYNNTQSFTAADFIGTFYKSEIPAGENNLYLQNNNLYYSESSNTTIKGTRAWIRLKQQQGSAPARARIVMGGQVATDINLVNGELVNGTVKVIENGQLILIRDGKKYNVMGARLQ